MPIARMCPCTHVCMCSVKIVKLSNDLIQSIPKCVLRKPMVPRGKQRKRN